MTSPLITLLFSFTQRGDDKRNGDIIPPLPFHMHPSAMSIYMRKKMGKALLSKSARSPSRPIPIIKDLPKLSGKVSFAFFLIKPFGAAC